MRVMQGGKEEWSRRYIAVDYARSAVHVLVTRHRMIRQGRAAEYPRAGRERRRKVSRLSDDLWRVIRREGRLVDDDVAFLCIHSNCYTFLRY